VYGAEPEDLPPNIPELRGKGIVISAYVDTDNAGDTVTRISRTGLFVYCYCALVCWMSMKQASIETSYFGSELCAMKLCTESISGLKIKLRMMGIGCACPDFTMRDN